MTRAEYVAAVRRPGLFEGQRPWIPYFWERRSAAEAVDVGQILDGEDIVYVATVTAADVEMWPELEVGQKVAFMETYSAVIRCSVPRFTLHPDEGL